MPVSEGTKKCQKSAALLNLLGALRTGPNPPAFPVTHHSSSSPTASINGAAAPSRNLMVSMPRRITTILSAQKHRKQTHGPALHDPQAGHRIRNIAWIAWPPIQV